MNGRSLDSPPTACAAVSAALASSSSSSSSSAQASADASSALITPTKAACEGEQQRQRQQQQQLSKKERKRQHTQLRLAVEREVGIGGASSSSRVVLKNKRRKKSLASSSSSSAAASDAPPPQASSAIRWPPASSAKSLPPLVGRVSDLWEAERRRQSTRRGRKRGTSARDASIEFEVNQECTSIGLVPSGRIAVAGFTDGTLRLFDLTGTFARDRNHPYNGRRNGKGGINELFDDDASTSSSSEESFHSDDSDDAADFGPSSPAKNAKSVSVDSRSNRRYGAVACQIHARGVHTSLLMDVAVSEDGLYAFGGVQRGSVELAAVYLGDVEGYLDEIQERREEDGKEKGKEAEAPGLLDLIQVDRHADAKLKGFGACKRLWNGWDRATKGGERPEYLLFTGKGIKNIHIWSYQPSRLEKDEDSVWTCLYDTPGNGTSINQLYFRHNAHGTLQGISKSDDQKLRVWDLSYEQRRIAAGGGADGGSDGASDRPRRPEYCDVASTEGTVGVCGPYAFAAGSLGYCSKIVNVIGLDADDASSPYNCTELALPSADAASGEGSVGVGGGRPSRSSGRQREQRGEVEPFAIGGAARRTGRQQRGDLKSVVGVAGLAFDASHALLQLSDGSVVHYMQRDRTGHPSLTLSPASLCATCIDDGGTSFGSTGQNSRRMSLARVGAEGMSLLAVSSFSESTSKGAIMLRALPGSGAAADGESYKNTAGRLRQYWGFYGLRKKRNKQAVAMAVVGSGGEKSPSSDSSRSSVGVISLDGTPVPFKNSKKTNSVSPTDPSTDKSSHFISKKRPYEEGMELEQVHCTAAPTEKVRKKSNSSKKATLGGLLLTLVNAHTKVNKPGCPKKKRPSEEGSEKMKTSQPVVPAPVPTTKIKNKLLIPSESAKKVVKSDRAGKKFPSEEGLRIAQAVYQSTESVPDPSSKSETLRAAKPGCPTKKLSREEGARLAQVVRQMEFTMVNPTKSEKKMPSPSDDKPGRLIEERLSEESPGLEQKIHILAESSPVATAKSKKVAAGDELQTPSESMTKCDKTGSYSEKSHPDEGSGLVQIESTPAPTKEEFYKPNSARKVTPGDLLPTSPNAEANNYNQQRKKRPAEEHIDLDRMDSQLESIVKGTNHSPKRFSTTDDYEEVSSSSNDMSRKKQKITQGKRDVADQNSETVAKSPPCSPRQSGRKKTQSSPKSSPKSSPAKNTMNLDVNVGYKNRQEGFLDATAMVSKKAVARPPEPCYRPNVRPPLLVEQLENSTVGNRLASVRTTVSSPPPNDRGTKVSAKESVHFERHSDERQALAAKHLAEHQMVQKKVLHSIRYVLSTWDVELDSTRPRGSIVDSVKRWFDEALMCHQEFLGDMIDRQLLEAESLAARQSAELSNDCAPTLQVSFPFPDVFEQARKEMHSVLQL